MVCRGRNHGAQRDGCERWDGGWGKTPRSKGGSTERAPKRGTGRVQQLAEGPGPGLQTQVQETTTEKQWGKNSRAVWLRACGCQHRQDGTSHPSPFPRKGPDVSPFTPWEKRGWPVPSVVDLASPRVPDAPTARPNRRRDAGSQSGPCFFPGCGMATCPQCAAACMHTEQGFVLREPGMEQAIQTPAQVPMWSAYLSISKHDIFSSQSQQQQHHSSTPDTLRKPGSDITMEGPWLAIRPSLALFALLRAQASPHAYPYTTKHQETKPPVEPYFRTQTKSSAQSLVLKLPPRISRAGCFHYRVTLWPSPLPVPSSAFSPLGGSSLSSSSRYIFPHSGSSS